MCQPESDEAHEKVNSKEGFSEVENGSNYHHLNVDLINLSCASISPLQAERECRRWFIIDIKCRPRIWATKLLRKSSISHFMCEHL